MNLGITRTWICRLNFAQRPIFQACGSLTSLKSQTRDPQLKVPSGGLVIRIFTSWKNPSTSAGFEPANVGSRGEHVTSRPPRTNIVYIAWETQSYTFFYILRHIFSVGCTDGCNFLALLWTTLLVQSTKNQWYLFKYTIIFSVLVALMGITSEHCCEQLCCYNQPKTNDIYLNILYFQCWLHWWG